MKKDSFIINVKDQNKHSIFITLLLKKITAFIKCNCERNCVKISK